MPILLANLIILHVQFHQCFSLGKGPKKSLHIYIPGWGALLTDVALRVNVSHCSSRISGRACQQVFLLLDKYSVDVRCPGCVRGESDSKIFEFFSHAQTVLLTSREMKEELEYRLP